MNSGLPPLVLDEVVEGVCRYEAFTLIIVGKPRVALRNVRLLEFIELVVFVPGKPELNGGLNALDLREESLTALSVALQSMK